MSAPCPFRAARHEASLGSIVGRHATTLALRRLRALDVTSYRPFRTGQPDCCRRASPHFFIHRKVCRAGDCIDFGGEVGSGPFGVDQSLCVLDLLERPLVLRIERAPLGLVRGPVGLSARHTIDARSRSPAELPELLRRFVRELPERIPIPRFGGRVHRVRLYLMLLIGSRADLWGLREPLIVDRHELASWWRALGPARVLAIVEGAYRPFGFADAEGWSVPGRGVACSLALLVLEDGAAEEGGRLAPKITTALPPKTGPLVLPITGIAMFLRRLGVQP